MYYRITTLLKTMWYMGKANPVLLCAWFFTFYFGLGGIQFSLRGQIQAGLPLILAGLIVCPPVHRFLDKRKLAIPRSAKVVSCLVLFAVYVHFVQLP